MSGAIAKPRIVEVTADILKVDRRELRIRVGNSVIFIEKKGDKYLISLFTLDGDRIIPQVYEVNHPLDVNGLDLDEDLKEAIAFYVSNWDYLRKMREAEIILKGKIKVAPQKISERETLAYQITMEVLNEREVRTFYTQESVLGIYCFNQEGGYYEPCEEEIKRDVVRLASDFPEQLQKTTKWVINEVLTKIQELTKTRWNPEAQMLVFNGKVFDWSRFLETGDLFGSVVDPDPELQVFHYIPHRLDLERVRSILEEREGLEKFIPPSTGEDVKRLFQVWAPKSYEAFRSWVGEENILLLLEIIGYTLYNGGYPHHRAVVLVGEGSNGKSTYLRLIKHILGQHNVTSITLKEITEERFAIAQFFMKLANIAAEPPKGILRNTDVFKKVTGEDLLCADRKFRDRICFVNYAKQIFAANELPKVNEDTYAFWRRWIVIKFPNVFKPDPTFYERTFTEEEIEGIILAALYAFYLVMKRGGFTIPKEHDPKEEWLKRSNPVYRVLKELEAEGIIKFGPDLSTTKKDLYTLYTAYVNGGYSEVDEVASKKALTETLEKFFKVTRDREKTGKRRRLYIGVGIADPKKYEEITGLKPDSVFEGGLDKYGQGQAENK